MAEDALLGELLFEVLELTKQSVRQLYQCRVVSNLLTCGSLSIYVSLRDIIDMVYILDS